MKKKTKKYLWWAALGGAAGYVAYSLSLTGKAARKVEEQTEIQAQSNYVKIP